MFQIDFITLVQNLAAEATVGGPLWTLVTAVCYLLALVYAIKSLLLFKEVSEGKVQSGMAAPMLAGLAAALLASVPEAIAASATAVFGPSVATSPLAYTSADAAASPVKAVFIVVQLIGYVFFVRGLIEVRRAGEPNRFQGASVTKAGTILLAGMAAIYINYTLEVIGSVTGWSVNSLLV